MGDLQKAEGGETFKCVWTKEESNVGNVHLLFARTEPESLSLVSFPPKSLSV